MATSIRKGTENDFDALMGLIKDLAVFEKSPDAVRNSPELMKLDKDFFGFFVAEDGGRIIGYALYFFAYFSWVGKSLYLEDIYVAPEHRGRKVGYLLMKRVVELAKSEGCRRMRWQVLSWNEKAIRFYKRCSAEVDDEWLNCTLDEAGIAGFLKSKT